MKLLSTSTLLALAMGVMAFHPIAAQYNDSNEDARQDRQQQNQRQDAQRQQQNRFQQDRYQEDQYEASDRDRTSWQQDRRRDQHGGFYEDDQDWEGRVQTSQPDQDQGYGYSERADDRDNRAQYSQRQSSRQYQQNAEYQQDAEQSQAGLGVVLTPDQLTNGVRVTEVKRGSPAARVGIRPGDVIIRIDNTIVTNPRETVRAVTERDPGQQVTIAVNRNGALYRMRARLTEREDALNISSQSQPNRQVQYLSSDDRFAQQYGDRDYDQSSQQYGDSDYDQSSQQYGDRDYDQSSQQYGDRDYDQSSQQYGDRDYNQLSQQYGDLDYDQSSQQYRDRDYDQTSQQDRDSDYRENSQQNSDREDRDRDDRQNSQSYRDRADQSSDSRRQTSRRDQPQDGDDAQGGLGVMLASDRDSNGVRVTEVMQGSPAARAGVRRGDVITRIGNSDVSSVREVVRAVTDKEPGQEVSITVNRNGQTQRLTAQLSERDDALNRSSRQRNRTPPDWRPSHR